MKRAILYVVPAILIALSIAVSILWLCCPLAMEFGIYYPEVPAWEEAPALGYVAQDVKTVKLGKDLWLTAHIVREDGQEPALQLLYRDRRTGNDLVPMDLARRIWSESEDFTGSGSYVAYYENRIILCLDAEEAPGCMPSDSMHHKFIYVDEQSFSDEAQQSIEAAAFSEDQWCYRELEAKYYLILSWLPENYVLTFGDKTLTAEDIVSAFERAPYGAYRAEVE